MSRTNVSVDIKSLEVEDPSKILAAIEAQQMATVGTRYLYCSVCQLPVRPRTAWMAKKAGKQHMCKRCSSVWVSAHRTVRDPNVYLCAICRIPLTGSRARFARYQSVRGMRMSCGNDACRVELSRQARAALAAVRAKPLEKCAICWSDATSSSSASARAQGTRAYCDKHKSGGKEREKCAICGQNATRKSSNKARVRGHRAYCDKHKGGKPSAT